MASKSLASPKTGKLYDEDFLVWTEETVRLLRAGRFDELDVDHVAEEIEDMGKSQKHQLRSRLRKLILHLLKWEHQPERRSTSWRRTINSQRVELRDLFADSPSLQSLMEESMARTYQDAVHEAILETGLPADSFPSRCRFTPEQILDRDFLPE